MNTLNVGHARKLLQNLSRTLTGGTASDFTCQAWTENDNLFSGTVGDPHATDTWTAAGTASCASSSHVYCFEL